MVYNTTYSNKEVEHEINALLGKSYGFLDRLRLGGIGSRRMTVADISPNYLQYVHQTSAINYANIERRPKGVIVHLMSGQKHYSWCIPYHQLVIYNSDELSIHAHGAYVKFKDGYALNRRFVHQLLEQKNNLITEHPLP